MSNKSIRWIALVAPRPARSDGERDAISIAIAGYGPYTGCKRFESIPFLDSQGSCSLGHVTFDSLLVSLFFLSCLSAFTTVTNLVSGDVIQTSCSSLWLIDRVELGFIWFKLRLSYHISFSREHCSFYIDQWTPETLKGNKNITFSSALNIFIYNSHKCWRDTCVLLP